MAEYYKEFPMLPFNLNALSLFKQLRGQKVRIGTRDLRIASIALANDLTLVTRNTSDYARVPNLKLEDWTK